MFGFWPNGVIMNNFFRPTSRKLMKQWHWIASLNSYCLIKNDDNSRSRFPRST